MIDFTQSIQPTGIEFTLKGEKSEIQYVHTWLKIYNQEHKFWLTSDVPALDHQTLTAVVFLDEDVSKNLNRIDFASLFKLTFSKFEINLPDASNTNSELMDRLEKLVDVVSNLPRNTNGELSEDMLDEIRKELELK